MARGNKASEGRGRLAESEAGDRLRANAQAAYQKGMEELKAQLERGMAYASQRDVADDKQDAKVAKAQKAFYGYRDGLGSDGLRDDVDFKSKIARGLMEEASDAMGKAKGVWYNSPPELQPKKPDGTPYANYREWENSPECHALIRKAYNDVKTSRAEEFQNAQEMVAKSADLLAAKFGVDKKSGLSLIGFSPGFYSNQFGRKAGFGEIIGQIAKAKADGKPYDNSVILAAKAFLAGQKVLYAEKVMNRQKELETTYTPKPARRGEKTYSHQVLYQEQSKFYKARDSYRAVEEMEQALNKALES